jgi:hypothetical protein
MKRTKAAHSKAGVEVVACFEALDEAAVCSGPGSRMAGSGGTMVFRVTEEREKTRGQKLLSVAKKRAGSKILARGT